MRSSVCTLSYFAAKVTFKWVRTAAAATALGLVAAAHAATVDRVTPTENCQVTLDVEGNNADLTLAAGKTSFELWSHWIDFASSIRVEGEGNSGSNKVSAKIIRKRGGAENASRGCEAKGSVVVEVTSPLAATSNLRRDLVLRQGDTRHRQGILIKQIRAIDATWRLNSQLECLVKTGSLVVDKNDKRVVLQLPPGADVDTSNCLLPPYAVMVNVATPNRQNVDVGSKFELKQPEITVEQFDQASNGFVESNNQPPLLVSDNGRELDQSSPPRRTMATVTLTPLNIRNVTRPAIVTITYATPNHQESQVTMEILPPTHLNAFTAKPICRNIGTGTSTVNANDPFQCELNVAIAPGPAPGQTINFEAIDSSCFAAGADYVIYNEATGLGSFNATGDATIFQIPLRALAGTTSAGTPCASLTGVGHILKFWLGPRDTESGPDFTLTNIRITQL